MFLYVSLYSFLFCYISLFHFVSMFHYISLCFIYIYVQLLYRHVSLFQYDSRFADPFWNSSKQTLSRHLVNILTSWALVCDVWYLPPEKQRDDETGLEFTNRIKAEIAHKGGLVDLDWCV